MRAGSPVRAGAWPEDADDLVAPWHTHELHQLLYAFEGVAEVETAGAHHLLPPQQAAWIPAGLPHQTTLRKVRTVRGVLRAVDGAGPRRPRARAPAAAPVREMIVYAARWRIDRPASDPTADAFFAALALLAAEWLDTTKRRCACRRARRRRSRRSWPTPRRTSPRSTSARCAPRSGCRSGRCAASSGPRPARAGRSIAPRAGCCAPWRCSPRLTPPSSTPRSRSGSRASAASTVRSCRLTGERPATTAVASAAR